MLAFIGLAVAWVVFWLILTMVINTFRAKNGANINDWYTVLMQGILSGPMAIMGAFSSESKAQGKTDSMLLGGIIGTIVFISIYQAL